MFDRRGVTKVARARAHASGNLRPVEEIFSRYDSLTYIQIQSVRGQAFTVKCSSASARKLVVANIKNQDI